MTELFCFYCGEPKGDKHMCCKEKHWKSREEEYSNKMKRTAFVNCINTTLINEDNPDKVNEDIVRRAFKFVSETSKKELVDEIYKLMQDIRDLKDIIRNVITYRKCENCKRYTRFDKDCTHCGK